MNDQLLNHLEGFNHGYEESPSDHHGGFSTVNAQTMSVHVDGTSRTGGVVIWAKDFHRRLVASDCWRDDVQKCLWVLPVGVILTEYIGIFLSLSITIVGFIILIFTQSRVNDRMTLQSLTRTTEPPSFNGIDQVKNCRNEVSRLLGWIGAPSLDWADLNFLSDIDTKPIDVSSEATSMVVDFLEAHAQLLVTVDEAYQWLRVSASLHLGLGPRSQCVDRVERAYIARSLRKGRKGETSGVEEGVGSIASRGVVGIPIVALSTMRGLLAQQIVDQYDSLRVLCNRMQDELGSLHRVDLDDSLHEPDVVDLAWIRDARQRVATMLSDSINLCATTDALVLFTESLKLRLWMQESMSSARNAHEFLQANLRLGELSIGGSPRPNQAMDPLHSSLLTYREHLFALLVATWSCEHCADNSVDVSDDSRGAWWNRMQELTSRCRLIESDIALRFFHDVDENTTSDEQDLECTGGRSILIATDFQLSDDGVAKPVSNLMDAPMASKTKVFKGHGAKLDRPAHTTKKNEGNRETANLRSRDFVLEQQMIHELRNRITQMRPLDDDDSDLEMEAESATKARLAHQPAPPIFLGASGLLLDELKMSLPMPSLLGGQEEELLL